MSRPNFLAPYDLSPVDHPIPQGVPLAAQLIQQVPLGQAVAEEGIASSSSLEEEIDWFQFEEEETQGVEAIVISEAEEETDEYLFIQTPAPIVIYVEDSSDNEVEEMAQKSGKSLRELMKGRNTAPIPQDTNKSKPPVNPSPAPSSASCWSWAKTQSWAEEKEAARRSWGGQDRPSKGKQTAEEVLGPMK